MKVLEAATKEAQGGRWQGKCLGFLVRHDQQPINLPRTNSYEISTCEVKARECFTTYVTFWTSLLSMHNAHIYLSNMIKFQGPFILASFCFDSYIKNKMRTKTCLICYFHFQFSILENKINISEIFESKKSFSTFLKKFPPLPACIRMCPLFVSSPTASFYPKTLLHKISNQICNPPSQVLKLIFHPLRREQDLHTPSHTAPISTNRCSART